MSAATVLNCFLYQLTIFPHVYRVAGSKILYILVNRVKFQPEKFLVGWDLNLRPSVLLVTKTAFLALTNSEFNVDRIVGIHEEICGRNPSENLGGISEKLVWKHSLWNILELFVVIFRKSPELTKFLVETLQEFLLAFLLEFLVGIDVESLF